MEPPHVIVASNYLLDQNSLSKDRWQIYEITKPKKLNEREN